MAIISECTHEDFILLDDKLVVKDLSTIGEGNTCLFEIPVFAYPSDTTDKYKNDFTAPLWFGGNRYNNVAFYLEVLENGCNWTEISILNDTTYGVYFNNAYFGNDWIGFVVQWYKVYNSEGVGCYRIRLEYDDIVESITKVEYSYRYNLALFNENLADKTTKIEYRIKGGKIGSTSDQQQVINYGANQWNREVRLPNSFFGFESSEYTEEWTRYKNGGQVWTKNSQIESINFNARKLPYTLHRELKITAMMADEIYLYDYNLSNPKPDMYNRFRVVKTSNYEPSWNLYNPYASVELTFKPYFENLERKRC